MFRSNILAIVLGFIIFVVAAVFFSNDLSTGKKLNYDEFYSLERSYGFEKHSDWLSVYSWNRPTAKKPPLQYWLTGVSMTLGMDDLLALRIWSYMFFLGLLLTGGALCFLVCEGNPWAGVAYLLILCNSCVLVSFGRSGYLDVGMGFFVMSSLLTLYLAKEHSGAWWICGLMVGLGALQKAPVSMIFVGVMLFILGRQKDDAYRWNLLRQTKSFNRGCLLAFFLFLSWPFVQTFRMGIEYFKVAIHKEMIKRFVPSDNKIATGETFDWIVWLWQDLHVFWIISALCVLLVLFSSKWRKNHFLFALTVLVTLTLIGFTFARGAIYIRYLAVLTPILVCVAVKVLSDLMKPWRPAVFVVAVFFSLFSFGHVESAVESINEEDTLSPARRYVAIIDQYRGEDEHVIIDKSITPPGAYGFYGKSLLRFKMINFESEKGIVGIKEFLAEEGENSKLIGLTYRSNKGLMEKSLGPLETTDVDSALMVWKYPGLRK